MDLLVLSTVPVVLAVVVVVLSPVILDGPVGDEILKAPEVVQVPNRVDGRDFFWWKINNNLSLYHPFFDKEKGGSNTFTKKHPCVFLVGFVSWKFSVRSDWMLSFKYGRWQIPKTFGMTHGRCRDKSPCHLCMCGDLVGCKSEKHVFQMNLMLTGFSILVRFGCCETEKRHPESKMYLLKQQLKRLPQW